MTFRLAVTAILSAAVLWPVSVHAQVDHAAHHPPAAGPPASPLMGAAAAPPAMGASPGAASAMAPAPGASPPMGGMAGMMSEMMTPKSPAGCVGGNCGSNATATPVYPSLMTLPSLTPEKRAEIDALASKQIDEGMTRLARGSEALNRATQAGDSLAMQQSVGLMRQGLGELEAGIAARRVLTEGKSPRNLALDWFKREMSLASPIAREEPRTLLGVTPFHLFTMALLVAFALAMVVMYFFKMRRAAALFGRIEADKGASPPGAAPPLAGGPEKGTPPKSGSSPPPSGEGPTTTGAALGEAPKAPPPSASGPSSKGKTSEPLPPSPGEKSPAPGSLPEGTAPSRSSPTAGPRPNNSPSPPSPAAQLPPTGRVKTSGAALTANWRGQLRVERILTETPSVKTFRIVPTSGDSLMPFTFVPGQFLNVAFSVGGARMNRSYSISSSPAAREYVELTVRREPRGAVSRHIDDLLKVGDEIEASGPVGRFTFAGTEADSIVLIAGGVGITPMMSIIRYLSALSWPGDIFFFYACRAPTDFIFQKELTELQRFNSKLHVTVTMSRPEGTDWKGPRGHLTKELLTKTVPEIASRRVHLCGPPSMMDATKALLTELGVPPEQVKTEAFGATRPSPSAPGTSSKPTAPADGPQVTFSKNAKTAKIHVDQTLLELSEELGIGIENSCRVGTCGVCKVKLTSGAVSMAVEDALDADDKANGIILACQAKPTGDIAVEA